MWTPLKHGSWAEHQRKSTNTITLHILLQREVLEEVHNLPLSLTSTLTLTLEIHKYFLLGCIMGFSSWVRLKFKCNYTSYNNYSFCLVFSSCSISHWYHSHLYIQGQYFYWTRERYSSVMSEHFLFKCFYCFCFHLLQGVPISVHFKACIYALVFLHQW